MEVCAWVRVVFVDNTKKTHKRVDASKEVCLEVNTEKTKYMLLSRHQNAGQNHDIKIGNRCFENVAQFRYLGAMTDRNLIQEEIKRRLNLGNSCYHSVQNLLSSRLQSCSTNWGTRNAYRILVGKPEGKRPLGRPRRRWVDNIRMNLKETGWDGIDWIDLAEDRDQWRALVNTVMNLRVL
ncbi:hypothetical protein B7P43_G06210 [Cryptotermes secundus]|uniref:Reverse transcriptase domain-containing protein n=1 Tax=Cryptotermes secundus TaxID=105785 RepID=A0A2J7QN44_9NEOP|nr:hypothetical protein B7P43_G06210 [Cryptotermes secundus]